MHKGKNQKLKLYYLSRIMLEKTDDENYYLIAYDEEADCIKHFRVDKMKSIEILKQRRVGRDKFREFNIAQ